MPPYLKSGGDMNNRAPIEPEKVLHDVGVYFTCIVNTQLSLKTDEKCFTISFLRKQPLDEEDALRRQCPKAFRY